MFIQQITKQWIDKSDLGSFEGSKDVQTALVAMSCLNYTLFSQ